MPILSTPYFEDGSIDYESLAAQTKFVAKWCPGVIWGQSNDSVELVTHDERLKAFDTCAAAVAGDPVVLALGANGTLSPRDVAPFRKDIEGAAALVMQLETPLETVAWAAKVAHDAGVAVILNPAPARKLPKSLYPLVDWITPNETEAELLTGVKVVDAASAAKAAGVLARRGVGHVVITMGSKGAYCGDCRRVYPCRKVKAVDCVAAGDTFNGAFAVALAEGKSCADAIAFAQKASAISVTRPGAQSSVPYRREIR